MQFMMWGVAAALGALPARQPSTVRRLTPVALAICAAVIVPLALFSSALKHMFSVTAFRSRPCRAPCAFPSAGYFANRKALAAHVPHFGNGRGI